MILKTFGWSFAITVAGLVGAFLYGSRDGTSAAFSALSVAAILIVLEVSLSFDNAVVNAKVLNKMSKFWQTMFLTVGILIAVFGMRLVFPFLVVWASAGLNPVDAWDLAMAGGHGEGSYAYILEEAHPIIAAFGGMFLMMIFLDFFTDDEKEHHWLGPIERPFQRLGAVSGISVAIALALLVIVGEVFRRTQPEEFTAEEFGSVLLAGILGLLTYLVVKGLGDAFESSSGLMDDEDEDDDGALAPAQVSGAEVALATGKAAFFMFLYLEVLDASFSFDGVIGAFAITTDPIVIAIGLGVGALYVRSITVYLVRKGTLAEYVYLEHGAHWAIGALAVLLFVTMGVSIPEVVTGLIGVVIIISALAWSIRENRLHPEEKHEVHV
ncbi:DUF475 domain-containing protein [Nocardioides sp. CPCC 205120]|uniref:DUF475 domain-containing protein n=1 Tax=Nocardioides sp. CPCC 205120 TaxID=3406462 RepID=UPI003B503024